MDNLDLTNIEVLEVYAERLVSYLPQILGALVFLAFGLKIIRFFRLRLEKLLEKRNYDPALQNFLISLFDVTLKVSVVISVASMLGVQTTSFLAILGSAGLAVGLALQGSLANFAGGVMLLLFKPFKAGNYIEAQGHQGTVRKLTIFHTVLTTPDNKRIILPNGPLANGSITNFSAEDKRRVDIPMSISYSDNIAKAKEILMSCMFEDERILQDPVPMVAVVSLGDNSVNLTVRAWVKTENYWPYFWDNMEKMKVRLEEGGITIPFPQRDVYLYQQNSK